MPRLLPMSVVLLFRLLAFVLVVVPTVCVAIAVVFDVVPHIHCVVLVFTAVARRHPRAFLSRKHLGRALVR